MLRLTPERNQWYPCADGYLVRQKLEDEILPETVDFTDVLATGEALSSATWDDVSGPTITGTTVASPLISFTITDSGDATLVVVTTTRTIRKRLRWAAPDGVYSGDYR